MTLPEFTLDGWDRDDDESSLTFIREDRLAKLTVIEVALADYDTGWMARLWVKDRPHGRARYVDNAVHPDPQVFREQARELAEGAP